MLKKLHDIISRKADFFESAKMLFESVINEDIDNFIVLEAAKEEEPEVVEDPANVQVPESELDPETEVENSEVNSRENEGMLKSDDTLTNNVPEDFENTPMNPDESDTVTSSKAEELADLMQITFDLTSNTMADVIPITPKGAAEAIDSNTLAPMDSNLSSSDPEDPGEAEPEDPEVDDKDDFDNTPLNPDEAEIIEEPKKDEESGEEDDDEKLKESFSIYEAVTFGSDDPAEKESEEEKPEENSEEAPDKKNAITNAVLDKVAESEEPAVEDPVADASKEDNGSGTKPADILKKLSTITDNIEATKKMILNNLNK